MADPKTLQKMANLMAQNKTNSRRKVFVLFVANLVTRPKIVVIGRVNEATMEGTMEEILEEILVVEDVVKQMLQNHQHNSLV